MAMFSRKRCPKEGAFVRLFLNSVSAGEREKILAHLGTCPDCRVRFDVLAEVRRAVGEKEETLQALARQSWTEVEARTRRTAGPAFWPRSWAARAAAAAGLFVVVAAAVVFALRTPGDSDVLRSGGGAEVRLLDPAGRVPEAPLYFRWTSVAGADFYVFDLVDDELKTIMETSTKSSYLLLSAEERRLLRSDRVYVWSITVFDDADVKLTAAQRSLAIE